MIRILASIPTPAQVNAGFLVGSITVTSGAVLTLIEPPERINFNVVNNMQKIVQDRFRATPTIQEATCAR